LPLEGRDDTLTVTGLGIELGAAWNSSTLESMLGTVRATQRKVKHAPELPIKGTPIAVTS
jgi:hypothetical protein